MNNFKELHAAFKNWELFLDCALKQLSDRELIDTMERARVTRNTIRRWKLGGIPALNPFLRFMEAVQETVDNQLKYTGQTTNR